MKFKAGDSVIVTAGKDKGMKSRILKVMPDNNKVIVEGANLYTRNYKPMQGQPGRQVRRERALTAASIAIINDKGLPDRIGYQVAKDGSKVRIYRKTGAVIPEPKPVETTKSK
jgi:large subunit ribosomal protein L24